MRCPMRWPIDSIALTTLDAARLLEYFRILALARQSRVRARLTTPTQTMIAAAVSLLAGAEALTVGVAPVVNARTTGPQMATGLVYSTTTGVRLQPSTHPFA